MPSDDDRKSKKKSRKRSRSRGSSSESGEASESDSETSSSSSSSEEERNKKRRKKEEKKMKKEKKKKEKKKKEKKHKKDKKKKKKKKKDKKRDKKEKGAVPRDNGMPGPVKITGRVGQVKLIAQNSSFGLVEKKILRLGTGRLPVKGQSMTIHCVGRLQAGQKVFWNTRDKYSKAYTFRVGCGKVISGWDEGCMAMHLGEKSLLTITGSYGYGMKGFEKWGIPSMATLEMEVEVIAISDDIELPSFEEISMRKMAAKHTFIDRTGDGAYSVPRFNAAPH